FWAPVAKTFTVKGKPATKRQLAKLAGNNANDLKPEESKDFKKIKELVLQYRKTVKQQAEQERKDRETFAALKTLMDKTEDKDIKQIRAALEKIKTVIS
ncbi:MAG: hypothetical protein LBH43_10260, partial [Treponema sp.]|nr:hypothetical protein [Treponema sp.]